MCSLGDGSFEGSGANAKQQADAGIKIHIDSVHPGQGYAIYNEGTRPVETARSVFGESEL